MLYLAGDDAEGKIGQYLSGAIKALERLDETGVVRTLVQLDTAGRNGTWRFAVQPDGRYTEGVNRWSLGERNMGDPAELRAFIRWARENYPANYYMLVVAGHGQGTTGIAYDDSSPDPSSIPPGQPSRIPVGKLGEALATEDGRKLDVVFFDACLMGLFENAYEIRNQARYLVASQNLTWSVFAYDRYVRAITSDTTPDQLARQIVQTYADHGELRRVPFTMSALDLSRAPPLRVALDEFAEALQEAIGAHKDEIGAARRAAQKFVTQDKDSDVPRYSGIDETDDYLDLYDFARQASQEIPDARVQTAAQRVMTAVTEIVVADRHQSGFPPMSSHLWGLDGARGVSIYFPHNEGWWFADYDLYREGDLFPWFEADGEWDDFIRAYFALLGLPHGQPRSQSYSASEQPRPPVHLPSLWKALNRP